MTTHDYRRLYFELVQSIAYPRRGTAEETLTINELARQLQQQYSLQHIHEQLDE